MHRLLILLAGAVIGYLAGGYLDGLRDDGNKPGCGTNGREEEA